MTLHRIEQPSDAQKVVQMLEALMLFAKVPITKNQLAVYLGALSQYPPSKVLDALTQFFRKGKWPSVEDIEAQMGVIIMTHVEPAIDEDLDEPEAPSIPEVATEDLDEGDFAWKFNVPTDMTNPEVIKQWKRGHLQRLREKGWTVYNYKTMDCTFVEQSHEGNQTFQSSKPGSVFWIYAFKKKPL